MGCFKDWARFVVLIGQIADRIKKNVAVLLHCSHLRNLADLLISKALSS